MTKKLIIKSNIIFFALHAFSTLLPAQNSIQQILNELAHEEQQLWKELERLKITKRMISLCQKARMHEYSTCRKEIENSATKKPLSQSLLELIKKVFKHYAVDIKSVAIIGYSDTKQVIIATDFQLFINEDEFLKFHPAAQEFLIAHEIQHIVHNDDSVRYFIYNQLSPTPEQMNDPEYIVNRFYRFQEKRADMLAAIHDPHYAQGNIKLLEPCQCQETSGISHPKESQRMAWAMDILKTVHQQPLVT